MNVLRQTTALAVAFVLVGIACLGAGMFQFIRVRTFVRTSVTAAGRVVDLEYRSSGSGKNHVGGYVTVFTFADDSGQTHTARTSSAQNPAMHQVANEVVVLYQPGSPAEARIRGFQTLWFVPTILAGFGFAFSGVGTLAFVAARKTYGSVPDDPAA